MAECCVMDIPCPLGGMIRIDLDTVEEPDPDWIAANIVVTHRRQDALKEGPSHGRNTERLY